MYALRSSDKHSHSNKASKSLFGVNFHEFIDQQDQSTMYEVASDFGISLGEVKKLKKRLNRS